MTALVRSVLSRLDGRARECLNVLGRKEAFARPCAAKNGVVQIFRRRSTGIKHVADCPQSIWTKFVALGLVCSCQVRREWALTPFGKDAAKRATATWRAGQRGNKGHLPADGPAPVMNDRESPLAWLASRKDRNGQAMVSAAQYQAGERLRHDFFQANLQPKVTMDWSMMPGAAGARRQAGTHADGLGINDVVATARSRVNAALAAVGPELAGILIDVCGHLKGLEVSEKDAGWPRRSGKVILQLALTRLARHYGFVRDETAPSAPGAPVIRHWGQDDFRPDADVDAECEAQVLD